MARVGKKQKERLDDIKQNVKRFREYYDDNIKRYHEYRNFVFRSTMTDSERQALQSIGKPDLEFNILEAFVSRLRGEFAKQQPQLQVRAADGLPSTMLTKNFVQTLDLIEAHLRNIFFGGTNDGLEYDVYTDLLTGGFSCVRVYTEYVNEMSFEQTIKVDRVFDPTLTGFDPLARTSHKGDGRYVFELYPMTRDDFEKKFGKDACQGMKFTRDLEGFGWSYKSEGEDIVLVCDYYEKKKVKKEIVKLTNGASVTSKEYEDFLQAWDNAGIMEQPPQVVRRRMTDIETICRYRFCENEVLDYVETNYRHLPLVFAQGSSANLTHGNNNYEMTRPYIYHAKGIQKLKNFAGQSLANELENSIQHKFIAALESVPEDYMDAYEDVQKADVLLYNYFHENNPDQPLPKPEVVARAPIPPEITNTFKLSDEVTQAILGSYDGASGVTDAKLSGVAFARSAIQSNNTSMPFVVGYIKAINRVAQIIVDLIPKYYRTPRSLPVMSPSGKRDYIEVNKKGSLYMNYDPHSMQVHVEAGVNFAMQKEIALQTIVSLSQSSKLFSDFINTEGLEILLDNIDIRGIDELKERATEFQKNIKQQQQQAQQVQQQEMQTKDKMQQMAMADAMRKLQTPSREQVDAFKAQTDANYKKAQVSIDEREAESKFIETLSKVRGQDIEAEIRQAEIDAENARTAIDAMTKLKNTMGESDE